MIQSFEGQFSKNYEKLKEFVLEDNLVEVKGRLSIRDGMKPSINVEEISYLDKEVLEENTVDVEEVEQKPTQRLCLIYYMQNQLQHETITKMLMEYPGESEVFIKDQATGQKYKSKITVDIRSSLIYELQTVIDENNIIVL